RHGDGALGSAHRCGHAPGGGRCGGGAGFGHADVGELLRELLALVGELDPVRITEGVRRGDFVEKTEEGTGQTAVFPEHADVDIGGRVAAIAAFGDVIEESGVHEVAVDVDAAGILRRAGSLPHAHHVTPDTDRVCRGDGVVARFGRSLVPAAVATRHDVVELVFGPAVDTDEPLVVTLVQDTEVSRRDLFGVQPGGQGVVRLGREVEQATGAAGPREVVRDVVGVGARLADQAVLGGHVTGHGGVQRVDPDGVHFFGIAAHVPHGTVAVGGIEHGGAVRLAVGVALAPVHGDLLGIVVALDGVDLHPDGGGRRAPRFDLVGQGGVAACEADVGAAGLRFGENGGLGGTEADQHGEVAHFTGDVRTGRGRVQRDLLARRPAGIRAGGDRRRQTDIGQRVGGLLAFVAQLDPVRAARDTGHRDLVD